MTQHPTFDADGYPTDKTLDKIEHWPINTFKDVSEVLAYVREAWRYPDYWRVAKRRSRQWKGAPLGRIHEVSTGGWSGNESLINAMERNVVLWTLIWIQVRRGGHYIFEEREQ